MEFSFTDEQVMIRDTAADFLNEVSGSDAVRLAMATEKGYDDHLWSRITKEMVWHAVHIPEKFGGLGLGYVELAAMLEQMGRRLLCSPFYATVCLGVNALLVAGTDAQKEKYLAQIVAEGATATLAYIGKGGGWDAPGITATFEMNSDDAVLNGSLRYVPNGHTADLLIIAARKIGSTGESGVGLFLVPADSNGISRTWLPTMDQTRKQADIVLSDVRVQADDVMRDPGDAWPLLAQVLDLACIGIAAEQMGGTQQVLDATVAYTMERQQFGRPVGGFQAMKHKAADMMLKAEAARSAVYYAACVAGEFFAGGDLGATLPEAASIAKAYCSDAYFHNAGHAIQMHGGIGFTWEHDIHLYFKRAKSSQQFLGDAVFHRERISRQILDDAS